MRPIPLDIVVPFLLEREAEVLRVYDDKAPRKILKPGDKVLGVLTAGVGHTGGLEIGMRVTRALSRAWLKSDLIHKAALPLERKIGSVVEELTKHQYAALLSFVFNLGTGNPKKPEWTIWKLLRARHFDQIPLQMMQFVNWDGKKSEALVARRAAEVALWAVSEPGSQPEAPASSVTRREPTPPTPADPTPAHKDAGVVAAGATAAVSAVGAIAQQAPETIKQGIAIVEPYADKSTIVSNMVSGMAAAAAGLALIVFAVSVAKKWRAQR